MQQEQHIIFIDGVCNLCNGLVQFIIKRDKRNLFKFSQLQSKFAQSALPQNLLQLQTVVYAKNGEYFTHSRAILEILSELPGLWTGIKFFQIIPTFLLDKLYVWIAKNRYNWFGKEKTCLIPLPEWQSKFLTD